MGGSIQYPVLFQDCDSTQLTWELASNLSVNGVKGMVSGSCRTQYTGSTTYNCEYTCLSSGVNDATVADLACVKILQKQYDYLRGKASGAALGTTSYATVSTDPSQPAQANVSEFSATFVASGCWSKVTYKLGTDSLTFYFTENRKGGRTALCDTVLAGTGVALNVRTYNANLVAMADFTVDFDRSKQKDKKKFTITALSVGTDVSSTFPLYLDSLRGVKSPVFEVYASVSQDVAGRVAGGSGGLGVGAETDAGDDAGFDAGDGAGDAPAAPASPGASTLSTPAPASRLPLSIPLNHVDVPEAHYLCYQTPGGLSAGAIAAIVIVVILVVALVVFLLLWFLVFRGRCASGGGSRARGSSGAASGASSGQHRGSSRRRRTRTAADDAPRPQKTPAASSAMYSATGSPAVGYERVPTRYTYAEPSPGYVRTKSPALGSSTPGMKTTKLTV